MPSRTDTVTHCYLVQYTTCVDRPALRHPAFRSAETAGHLIPANISTCLQKTAVGLFGEILDGCFDYESEFVCEVGIQRMTLEIGKQVRYTCVRRTVYRERRGNNVLIQERCAHSA